MVYIHEVLLALAAFVAALPTKSHTTGQAKTVVTEMDGLFSKVDGELADPVHDGSWIRDVSRTAEENWDEVVRMARDWGNPGVGKASGHPLTDSPPYASLVEIDARLRKLALLESPKPHKPATALAIEVKAPNSEKLPGLKTVLSGVSREPILIASGGGQSLRGKEDPADPQMAGRVLGFMVSNGSIQSAGGKKGK